MIELKVRIPTEIEDRVLNEYCFQHGYGVSPDGTPVVQSETQIEFAEKMLLEHVMQSVLSFESKVESKRLEEIMIEAKSRLDDTNATMKEDLRAIFSKSSI